MSQKIITVINNYFCDKNSWKHSYLSVGGGEIYYKPHVF